MPKKKQPGYHTLAMPFSPITMATVTPVNSKKAIAVLSSKASFAMIITSCLQYLCSGEVKALNYTANGNDRSPSVAEMPFFLDPKLLRVARRLYRDYCVHNPKSPKRPLGIAIHKHTHRGQLMFNQQPILLPGECFVPVKQLELEAR